MIDGNSSSIDTRTRSLAKNGSTPLNVSDIGMSPAILLIIKTLRPTGGVIRPTSTTIKVRIPNQIAVSSAVRPKSSVMMRGKKIGMVKKIDGKKLPLILF
mgnify:CR=1 FL=1